MLKAVASMATAALRTLIFCQVLKSSFCCFHNTGIKIFVSDWKHVDTTTMYTTNCKTVKESRKVFIRKFIQP